MGAPGKGANLPVLSQTFETTVPGIFIAGELSGMGLIKNAVMQGTAVGKEIARRVHSEGPRQSNASLDVAVIGAGPAGLAVALSAMGDGLRYIVLEQGDAGGTILHYPRRKIVMTAPVELPVWGPLKFRETTKENLLAVWKEIVQKTGLEVHNREKVTGVTKEGEFYRVVTDKGTYAARYIVLALGRRGTPRTLGVPGEDLPKVMYQLIDASTYRDTHVLVVGGGDSAVEAAVGLAVQKSNNVTLSYRKPEFTRIKARNEEHVRYYQKKGIIRVVMSSTVAEIREREVILRTPEGMEQLRNDVVFVFAGGELPFEFLKNVGIEFQQQAVA
jgi:putative YpdA family bacillithiol system oxidoreductase